MAWLEKRGGSYHLGVRFGTQKWKRSLKTTDTKEAELLLARVERRVSLIEQGDLVAPANVDFLDFLLEIKPKPELEPRTTGITLGTLTDQYLDSTAARMLEANTLLTARIHIQHLVREFGSKFRIDRLRFADLQSYVDARSNRKGKNGRPLSCVTIRKEIATFSAIWNWGIKMGRFGGRAGIVDNGLQLSF